MEQVDRTHTHTHPPPERKQFSSVLNNAQDQL